MTLQQLAEALWSCTRVLLDLMVLFLLQPKFSWCSFSSGAVMGAGCILSLQKHLVPWVTMSPARHHPVTQLLTAGYFLILLLLSLKNKKSNDHK